MERHVYFIYFIDAISKQQRAQKQQGLGRLCDGRVNQNTLRSILPLSINSYFWQSHMDDISHHWPWHRCSNCSGLQTSKVTALKSSAGLKTVHAASVLLTGIAWLPWFRFFFFTKGAVPGTIAPPSFRRCSRALIWARRWLRHVGAHGREEGVSLGCDIL